MDFLNGVIASGTSWSRAAKVSRPDLNPQLPSQVTKLLDPENKKFLIFFIPSNTSTLLAQDDGRAHASMSSCLSGFFRFDNIAAINNVALG